MERIADAAEGKHRVSTGSALISRLAQAGVLEDVLTLHAYSGTGTGTVWRCSCGEVGHPPERAGVAGWSFHVARKLRGVLLS